MGLAALLHDVGKLSIPLSILNKPGRLEGEEWNVMMGHVELGGWHLGGLEASAPLSILVAYEHHLRFDGQPNYPPLRTPRRPNTRDDGHRGCLRRGVHDVPLNAL
jgi:response regulator RpfG family c-di-GMP phosphodiesterase